VCVCVCVFVSSRFAEATGGKSRRASDSFKASGVSCSSTVCVCMCVYVCVCVCVCVFWICRSGESYELACAHSKLLRRNLFFDATRDTATRNTATRNTATRDTATRDTATRDALTCASILFEILVSWVTWTEYGAFWTEYWAI